ncbi:hypothetical protein ACN267_25940 [Micromonospora sp. WMMD734]|uniref:hypothetical protein n=1 Tax=Micromonospora sp. WMMD734 TaxID=3404129 RepID=UPI003B953EFA
MSTLEPAAGRPRSAQGRSFVRQRAGVAAAILMAAIPTLTGCPAQSDDRPSERGPSSAPTGPSSQEIRAIDFAGREWFDAVTNSTVQLRDGKAERRGDEGMDAYRWKMAGPPRYADADGDGDTDAAVGLAVEGGQTSSVSWYIWLWHEGDAQQLRRPIAEASRCDGLIEAVDPVPTGFSVEGFVWGPEDDCAGGGSVPIAYVAAVRQGWPVRISPRLGPITTCSPGELAEHLVPTSEVLLHTWPDGRSPVVEPAARYDALITDYSELTGRWTLVVALRGEDRICGWAESTLIRRG